MPCWYTTPEKVASYLNLTVFSATTVPTKSTVENMIKHIEEDIDGKILTSYREHSVYNEIRNLDHSYVTGSGIPVRPNYGPLLAFDTTKGDKIEVWNGSAWADFLTTGTDSRSTGDYWTEENAIWFRSQTVWATRNKIRLTYRYGRFAETTIDGDQSKATATVTVASTTGFDVSGYFRVYNADGSTQEINYTSKTSTTFTGCTWDANNTTGTDVTSGLKVFQTSSDVEDLATKLIIIELLRMNFRTNMIPISGELSISEIISGLQKDTDRKLQELKVIKVLG